MIRALARQRVCFAFATVCLAALGLRMPAHAEALNEDSARRVANEVRLLVGEGTGVINDLQPAINGGKVVKSEATPDALVAQFKARYEKAAGAPFDPRAPGALGEARRAYLNSFTAVVTRFQPIIDRGGQDAFVPAFFRAQVLKHFNQQMQGTLQAYATNRDNELINTEWSVQTVMKGSPLAAEVKELMGAGGLEPVVKRSGNTMMGYYPMKLAPGCVSCHARNGLKQTEGGFGGVLVAEIPIK